MLRTLAKLLAAPLAVLALTGASYQGAHYTVQFPDFATPQRLDNGLIEVREAGTSANCNVDDRDAPQLSATQEQINAQFGHAWTVAEWADFLGVAAGELTVVSSTVEPLGDKYLHVAMLRTTFQGNDVTFVRSHFLMPGRAVMLGCYARSSEYAAYAARFDATIRSLRPL